MVSITGEKGSIVPNPFFPRQGQEATFLLPTGHGPVYTIKIFNLRGWQLRTLESSNHWDGKDQSGRICEQGVYVMQYKNKDGKRLNATIVLLDN